MAGLALFLAAPLAAQLDRATLNGTITDASGAALAGAKVTAVHAGSGLVRATQTEAGSYVMPQLPIGVYTVTIEASGFQAVRFEKVQLQVGQIRTLDAQLEVAATTTQVEVRDTMAALDRSSAEVGTVIQSSQLAELPINGRHWAGLMLLAPGAINTGEGFQDDVRFVGRANDDNNWTFDGIDNTAIKDPTYGASARLVVSMDSIAEFKVSSSLYSAESGGGVGGQVHLVSKSGSNQYHGGLFEYFRNSALDARTIFDGPELAPFRLNQFGGNFGGPIKTNKLFFFGNYEGLRQRQGSVYTYNVPSAALRSRVIAGAPALRELMDAYPAGTRTTRDANVDELVQSWSTKGTEDSFMGRVDYQISDRTTLFGRYNGNNARLSNPAGMRPEYVDRELQHTKNLLVQLQHAFSPSMFNETRAGIHRVPRKEEDRGLFNETVNVPGITAIPNNDGQHEIGTSYSLINNLSVFHGRHNLKFGGEVRRVHVNVWWAAARSASFASVNDFTRNAVDSISISGEMATRGGRRTLWFGYVQDEFKASRTLTLSLGARYEYYSVMKEVKDRILVFDAVKGDFAPAGTPTYNPDRDNIAPRVSLAWAPDLFKQKTVIRGGYGMYYGPGQMDDVMASIESTQETFRLTAADLPGLSYPIEPFLSQAKAQGLTPRHIIPHRRDMYSQNWGLSVQQMMPAQFTMQVGYIGNNAHKILSRTYINLIDPVTGLRPWSKFGRIDSKEDAGNGSFNALQVSLKRRMSGGLMWQSEYMWGHALNDGMIGAGESTAPQNVNDRRAGKADSNYDIRHTLTTNVVWALPFGPGRPYLPSGLASKIAGGWELSAIHAARTGRAITFTVSRSSRDLPDGNSSNQRPDIVPGVPIYPEKQTLDNWFNIAAFAVPARGTWGNAARNLGRGPGVNQLDLSAQKTVNLSESHRIAFRAEFFNSFNRPHLGTPAANLSSPGTFGRITSPMNRTIGTGTARQIQFMLRYIF
jgi:hypothetical protein